METKTYKVHFCATIYADNDFLISVPANADIKEVEEQAKEQLIFEQPEGYSVEFFECYSIEEIKPQTDES